MLSTLTLPSDPTGPKAARDEATSHECGIGVATARVCNCLDKIFMASSTQSLWELWPVSELLCNMQDIGH